MNPLQVVHRCAIGVAAAALVLCAGQATAQVITAPANRFVLSTGSVVPRPIDVTTGDFNGDGRMDVALASESNVATGFITVYDVAPEGLQQLWQHVGPARGIKAADFNRDGHLDIATVMGHPDHPGELQIRLGNGDGTFGAATVYPTEQLPMDVTVTDVNADGHVDILVFNAWGESFGVYLANGDGTFAGPADYLMMGIGASSLTTGDFDQDGDVDVVFAGADSRFVRFRNDGLGDFSDYLTVLGTVDHADNLMSVLSGDFNGDGRRDLAAIYGFSHTIGIRLGTGSFGFAPEVRISVPGVREGVVLDADLDGDLDFITAGDNGGVAFVEGNGDGSFQPAVPGPLGEFLRTLAVGEFNGDGRADVVTLGSQTLHLLHGRYIARQTIDFPAIGSRTFGDPPIELSVAASSGLPVELAVSGPGTLTGNTLTIDAAGTITVTASQAGNDDFLPVELSQTFVVSPRTATLTWPVPANIPVYTELDGTHLNATADVAGTFTYTPPAGTSLGLGSHQLRVDFEPDDPNYGAATAFVSITVTRRLPELTWEPAFSSIVYGSPVNSALLNATTNVPGTLTYDPPHGTVLDAGFETLRLTFTPDDPNYLAIVATRPLQITPATPTVTWPNPAEIVYGTPLGSGQLNATARHLVFPNEVIVHGAYEYSPAAGTILNGGEHTLTLTFRPSPSYNYEPVTLTRTINVRAAATTITWEPFTPMENGVPLGPAQLNASANGPGTFTYDPPAGTILPGGFNHVRATFNPANAANFEPASDVRTIWVNQLTPQVTWVVPRAIAGQPLGPQHFAATANVPGTFTYVQEPGDVFPLAGTYMLNAVFRPDDVRNYVQVNVQRNIEVDLDTPVITWNPAPYVYGTPVTAAQLNATANVPGTFTYDPPLGGVPQLIQSPDPLVMMLRVWFTPSDHRVYRSIEDLRIPVSTARGEVEIAWADPAPIVYGTQLGAAQLNATRTATGLVPPPGLTYSQPAGTLLNAGAHTLTVRSPESTFYREATMTVTLEVQPRPVTLQWTPPAPISYGTRLHGGILNATASGGFGPPIPIQYNPGHNIQLAAGTHTLTASVGSPNYQADPVSVALVVNAVPLLVMPAYNSRDYYAPQPASIPPDEYTGMQGLVPGDLLTVSFVTTAVDGSPGGDYPLTPVFNDPFGVLGNYVVASVYSSFTVYWPSAFIATVTPQAVVRGSGDTTVTLSGDGFIAGTTQLTLNGAPIPFTFNSSSEIDVVIPAAALLDRGVAFLNVTNDPANIGWPKELFITDAPTTVDVAYTFQGWDGEEPAIFDLGTDGSGATSYLIETLGAGVFTFAHFTSNPAPALSGGHNHFAVFTQPGFSALTIQTCSVDADARRLMWFNGSAWIPVAAQTFVEGAPSCIRAAITNDTIPALSDLARIYFAVAGEGGDTDSEPPSITSSASPDVLWPANGALLPVTISGVILDSGGGIDTATVRVIDEYGSVQPGCAVTISPDGSYSVTLMLEASRLTGDADGRRYRIVVDAADRAGNTASAESIAVVPQFVDSNLQGRMLGDGRLGDGATYYDVSVNAKEHNSTGELGYFNVKRVTPERTDRFVSESVTGVAFMLGSGTFIDSVFYVGTGRWNGQSGYRFEAYVIDRGDPGPGTDEVRFTVVDPAGAVVAQYGGVLTRWNIRSATY